MVRDAESGDGAQQGDSGQCPVCGSDEYRTVNVRVPPGETFGGGPSARRHWGGKNIARCSTCGVVFDPDVGETSDNEDTEGSQ